VTDVLVGTDGRPLAARGQRTRARLLEAAEKVFAELGYNDASIVKITEAAGVGQGTFYLYFPGKAEIFDCLVRDLNRRVRRAMSEAAEKGETRIQAELNGFHAFFRFTAEHPALYRIIRQAEFASPETLQFHYDRLVEGYVVALKQAMDVGEIARRDPEVLAWALMGIGELIGMRYILWAGQNDVSQHVLDEIERIIRCVLEPREEE
jgi:AcrR family transcriptional regulator